MRIIAKCPICGLSWMLEADAADRRIRCPKCGRLFRVPKLQEVSKAVRILKQTKGTIYVDKNGRTYG